MAGNNVLLVLIAAFILLFAGCPQQQAAPAPTPTPAPQPAQCAGTGANYCNGAELMKDARCVQGTWQYSSEVCANGCEAGKCKEVAPAPAPAPEPAVELCAGIKTNYSMPYTEAEQIANASGACSELENLTYKNHYCNENSGTWWLEPQAMINGCAPACVVFADNKTAEINWKCTGAIPTPAPTPAPVVTPAPAPEAVPPTAAELKKLLACGSDFNSKTYRFNWNDAYTSQNYEVKVSNSIQSRYIQTNMEYTGMPSPEFSRVIVSDYRDPTTCACTSRQLSTKYNPYGSRTGGETAGGGTCGVAPPPLKGTDFLYDNIDDTKIMKLGTELVGFMAYSGFADHFYQESRTADGTVLKASYYLASGIPLTIRINGTARYADGTSNNFVLELLP